MKENVFGVKNVPTLGCSACSGYIKVVTNQQDMPVILARNCTAWYLITSIFVAFGG